MSSTSIWRQMLEQPDRLVEGLATQVMETIQDRVVKRMNELLEETIRDETAEVLKDFKVTMTKNMMEQSFRIDAYIDGINVDNKVKFAERK
jgi:uncharacterized protein YpuA (DUF1002 family)